MKAIKGTLFSILFVSLSLISGCDKRENLKSGFLQGIISIGPICPVEKIPPDPSCLPTAETYKAYPVGVYTANGKAEILHLNPALDGTYSAELPSGDYLVKLSDTHYIGGSNLPVEVSVAPQENTLLNITIDTGIR